ncbi:hypothetical protein F5Y07DRAFT_362811 [Xylaria sp. FL0933]|nr:hypothetical protein F5Y07DRAFT_362811 [Xylaria sp. FL0933]
MAPRPLVRGKFTEKQQGLLDKIQQKWGILPWQMFPDDSSRHPKAWTAELLQALCNLAAVAPLEQVTKIFERTDSQITKELVNYALAECLRTNTHQIPAPISPKTPVNGGADAKDVVFGANDTESHQSHLARVARRAGSLVIHSERPGRTRLRSDSVIRFGSDSPPAKRRKTQDGPSKPAPSPMVLKRTTAQPHSPQFKLNEPFPCEDVTQYAKHITSLIIWGRQNLENQGNRHSREVHQASSRLDALRTEEEKLNKSREQAENDEKTTGAKISEFEKIIESLLDIEKQQEQLTAQTNLLEAQKSGITSGDNINVQAPDCEQGQVKETEARLLKSQTWSLELDDLKQRLSTIIEHKDETLSKIQAVKKNFTTTEKQLQEGKDAGVVADKELKKWKIVVDHFMLGLEAAGFIPQQRAPEEST